MLTTTIPTLYTILNRICLILTHTYTTTHTYIYYSTSLILTTLNIPQHKTSIPQYTSTHYILNNIKTSSYTNLHMLIINKSEHYTYKYLSKDLIVSQALSK